MSVVVRLGFIYLGYRVGVRVRGEVGIEVIVGEGVGVGVRGEGF